MPTEGLAQGVSKDDTPEEERRRDGGRAAVVDDPEDQPEMRDPHVVRLRYRVGPAARSEPVTYHEPPPIERNVGPFSLRLADSILTVILAEHHAHEASARARVERYLRAWEISAALQLGQGALAFRFERADVVDRNPPHPMDSPTPQLAKRSQAAAAGAAAPPTPRRQYPEPPDGFAVSPDVETLWHRYQGYLDGKEPIGGLAYFVREFIEGRYGGKRRAAALLGISRKVLQRLGQLSTEYRYLPTRRKYAEPSGPATDRERTWLEAVVKTVIRRLGEWSADPDAERPEVTMQNLPGLG